MDTNKYVDNLRLTKESISETLSGSCIPDELPVEENIPATNPDSSAQRIKSVSYGGLSVGALSLISGLIIGKSGIAALGGGLSLLSLGGIYYANTKSNETRSRICNNPKVNFQELNNEIFSRVSKITRAATAKWDDTVQANKTLLNSEILSSSIDEKKKTYLLALASKEESLNIQFSDFAKHLRQLSDEEDLQQIKDFVASFQADALKELNISYQRQIDIYSEIN